ncbi:hypothetical protein F4809DRAFT_595342 [Biscogniauxia mediterranea]|nr:hypothetical protein F4809DRAFT_595342 [Biscogniauxia mediterranea]
MFIIICVQLVCLAHPSKGAGNQLVDKLSALTKQGVAPSPSYQVILLHSLPPLPPFLCIISPARLCARNKKKSLTVRWRDTSPAYMVIHFSTLPSE